jgi:hypothetical protein
MFLYQCEWENILHVALYCFVEMKTQQKSYKTTRRHVLEDINKVHPTTGHEGPEGEYRHTSTLSLTSALDGGGWLSRPDRFTPGNKTWCPLYRRLGGRQGQFGRLREVWPPTGIRSPDRPARSESLYRLSYRGPPHARRH